MWNTVAEFRRRAAESAAAQGHSPRSPLASHPGCSRTCTRLAAVSCTGTPSLLGQRTLRSARRRNDHAGRLFSHGPGAEIMIPVGPGVCRAQPVHLVVKIDVRARLNLVLPVRLPPAHRRLGDETVRSDLPVVHEPEELVHVGHSVPGEGGVYVDANAGLEEQVHRASGTNPRTLAAHGVVMRRYPGVKAHGYPVEHLRNFGYAACGDVMPVRYDIGDKAGILRVPGDGQHVPSRE